MRKQRAVVALAAGMVALGLLEGAHGATFTWNGSGTDANLGTGGNWVGGVTPPGANASDVIFTGTTGLNPIAQDPSIFKAAYKTVTFNATAGAFTFTGDGSGNSDFEFNGNFAVTSANNSLFTQTFNVDQIQLRRGTITAATADFVFNGKFNVGATASQSNITLTGTHDFYVNGGLVGNSALTKTGTGTLYLGAAPVSSINTSASPNGLWGKALNINAGKVVINSSTSLGEVGDAGGNDGYTYVSGASSTLALTNNLSTSEYLFLEERTDFTPAIINQSGHNILTGEIDSNPSLTKNGNVTLQSDGTAAGDLLEIASGPTGLNSIHQVIVGTATLVLQGAGNGLISAPILDSGPGSNTIWKVDKKGTGTWTLSNSFPFGYAGTTVIEQGTLAATDPNPIANTPSIAVNSGAKFDISAIGGGISLNGSRTLKGAGTVIGSLTAGGGTTIAPGDNGPGTLTLSGSSSSLSLNDGTLLQFEMAGTATGTGDVIAVGGNLTLSGTTTLTITKLAGSLASGNYKLFTYGGSLSGDATNFSVVGGAGGTTRQNFVIDTAVNHLITLDVSGSAANLTWVGDGVANAWNVNGTVNWTGAPGATPNNRFFNGDLVTFTDAGSSTPVINVSGAVAPAQVTFANATKTFKIGGGDINVAGNLVASGAGNVTLSNAGLTTTGDVTSTSSGALTINNSGQTVIGGNVIASGAGDVNFTNANLTVGGNVTAGNGGTLSISNTGSTSFNGSITTTDARNLTIANSNNTVNIAGDMTVGGSGSLNVSGNSVAVTGNVNVATSGNVNLANNDFTVGGAFNLGQTGTGTITVGNSGNLTAITSASLAGGTLAITRSGNTSLGALTGVGTLQQQGTGITTLTGNDSAFGGAIVVASGTVQLGATSTLALGTAVMGTMVLSGGTLDLNGKSNPTSIVTVSGNGAPGQSGAIFTTSKTRAVIDGLILAGDTTLYAPTGTNPAIADPNNLGSLQGNGHNLTVVGAGEWDFNNVGETHLANITLKDNAGGDGTYWIGNSTFGDQPGVVTLVNNGSIGLQDTTTTFTKSIVVDSSGSGRGEIEPYHADANIASPITLNGSLDVVNFSYFDANLVGTITVTLGGKITGPGSLTVHSQSNLGATGTAAQKLAIFTQRFGAVAITSDDNDYTGTTIIGGGYGTSGFGAAPATSDSVTLSIGNGGTTGKLGPGDVTVNALATLAFNKNATYNFANNVSGAGNITGSAGAVTLTGNLSYTGATTVNGGSLRVNKSIATSSGVTANTGGTYIAGSTQTLAALTINDGGRAQIAAAAGSKKTLTVLAFAPTSITGTGVMDVNDGQLILPYTGTSPVAGIAALLAGGFNVGAWNGAGINSTAAANDARSITALGYNDNGSQIIVDYTYYGDNDLSGSVTTTDFQMFLDGLTTNGSTWSQGDYTYDGKVDLGNDFNLFLSAYMTQGGSLGDLAPIISADDLLTASQKASLLAVVPEPSSVTVLGMAAAGLVGRRRRKTCATK